MKYQGALTLALGALMISGCGGGGQADNSACTATAAAVAKTTAATVSSVSQGSGVFSIQGDAMDGVAGIDLNISYPYPDLSSPSVTQGALISGAMMVANTNTPGNIKIAIISSKGFTGSGELVRISFANKGSGSIAVSASMINSSGAALGSSGSAAGSASTTGGTTSGSTTTTTPSASTAACP